MPSLTLTRSLTPVFALAFAACGDAPGAPADTLDAGEIIATPDTGTPDAAADVDSTADADSLAHVPPTPDLPGPDDTRSFSLSELGLFHDGAPAPDLVAFAPRYALWSDGLVKRRWLRLPPGARIDTSDPDLWQLPVGAVLFKEFATATRPLETRVIARTGSGRFDYWMGAFVWRDDLSDADFVRAGAIDVAGTDHDVPSAEACWSCHNGTAGRVLGLATLQLSDPPPGSTSLEDLAPFMTAPPDPYTLPGDATAEAALGYLHANCGHCHNPNGTARPDTDLDLSVSVHDAALEDVGAWRTGVGVPTRSWSHADAPLRIAPGDPDTSAVVVRMRARGDKDQMPPLATEHVDTQGLATVEAWVGGLVNAP